MVPVAQLLLPGSAATTEPLLEGPPVARATLGKTIADLARRPRWCGAPPTRSRRASASLSLPSLMIYLAARTSAVAGAAWRCAGRDLRTGRRRGVHSGGRSRGRVTRSVPVRETPAAAARRAARGRRLGSRWSPRGDGAAAVPPLDAFGGAAVAGAATIGFVGPALAEAAASAGDESRVMAGGIVAVDRGPRRRRDAGRDAPERFAVCACAQAVAALLLAGALLCRRLLMAVCFVLSPSRSRLARVPIRQVFALAQLGGADARERAIDARQIGPRCPAPARFSSSCRYSLSRYAHASIGFTPARTSRRFPGRRRPRQGGHPSRGYGASLVSTAVASAAASSNADPRADLALRPRLGIVLWGLAGLEERPERNVVLPTRLSPLYWLQGHAVAVLTMGALACTAGSFGRDRPSSRPYLAI